MEKTVKMVREILADMYKQFKQKHADYGGSVFAMGEKGVFVRVFDKVKRLETLVWKGQKAQVKDETIRDTWEDLAVYAILGLVAHEIQQEKKKEEKDRSKK